MKAKNWIEIYDEFMKSSAFLADNRHTAFLIWIQETYPNGISFNDSGEGDNQDDGWIYIDVAPEFMKPFVPLSDTYSEDFIVTNGDEVGIGYARKDALNGQVTWLLKGTGEFKPEWYKKFMPLPPTNSQSKD